MAISDNKTRTILTLEKKTKKTLEKIAEKENRSLNNLIETIIKEYLKDKS